ncbi:MAG: tetratricopeptide repeat protein [Paludibacteraceae bacterium]|nr:tetratricopeptide repeat protein [Paludibacteraceae bacterium]
MIGKRYIAYSGLLLVACCCATSCSTQKNTAATRAYHQMKVRYNILYNGNHAYEEGLKAIQSANVDDYSQVLNLYPVSNHQAAASSASKMDVTIEKCRKCIKLHSIKKKPQPDPKRRKDPKYKLWLQSEEFNGEMGNAWIRLGEAEFHKADFLGAIGTFSYVMKHYQNDPDMVARCQLWIARAYGELGWLYEAEDMLHKVKETDLSKKHAPLFAAASADILLKNKQYKSALPYVKVAVPHEKRKVYRPRFEYVLGQLYEHEGNRREAINAYEKVIKLTPPVEMDFNARIRIAQLKGKSSLKQLRRMAKQAKYKDKLDYIYGTMGNIYLASKDTARALEHYHMAIDKSTQAGMQKAAILIKAGDIYYGCQEYVKAQPCYREAITILTAENDDFARIQRRSEVLDELIVEHEVVVLQDSLQRLSRLSEQEQRAIVERLIEELIKQEAADAEAALIAEREAANGGLQSVNTANMLGGNGASADWYFYNPQLMRSGKQEFLKKWGSRTLEDNWRRLSKAVSAPMIAENESEEGTEDMNLSSDSTVVGDSLKPAFVPETDNHKPEYYLQQIPKTEADLALSDSLIRQALVNMLYIYQDKMEDQALADETFEELCRRYPHHAALLDLYYMYYLQALRAGNQAEAQRLAQEIITYYPDSKQAYIVSQPDYFARLQRMAAEQDSLYESTYKAFTAGDFAQVKHNKQYAEEHYPLSPLMPRFLFLNAVSVARTEGQDAFADALRDMVSKYPESELGAMAKDMLAMMGQGMESQQGAGTGSLATLRGEIAQTEEEEEPSGEEEMTWIEDSEVASVVLLALHTSDEALLNLLQYEVALFNFSQFMIRDFDLQKMPVFGAGSALRVGGFSTLDEAEWWAGLVRQNEELTAFLQSHNVEIIPVAEQNVNKVISNR